MPFFRTFDEAADYAAQQPCEICSKNPAGDSIMDIDQHYISACSSCIRVFIDAGKENRIGINYISREEWRRRVNER